MHKVARGYLTAWGSIQGKLSCKPLLPGGILHIACLFMCMLSKLTDALRMCFCHCKENYSISQHAWIVPLLQSPLECSLSGSANQLRLIICIYAIYMAGCMTVSSPWPRDFRAPAVSGNSLIGPLGLFQIYSIDGVCGCACVARLEHRTRDLKV